MTKSVWTLPPSSVDLGDKFASEQDCLQDLKDCVQLSPEARRHVEQRAKAYVSALREPGKVTFMARLLRSFGLDKAEGRALMQLAEALLRTPDSRTRNLLIEDKLISDGWLHHCHQLPWGRIKILVFGLYAVSTLFSAAQKSWLGRQFLKLAQAPVRFGALLAMRLMGDHFVLGQDMAQALRRSRPLLRQGYGYSYDMLGEADVTQADASAYAEAYRRAIQALAQQAPSTCPHDNPSISIKLSALHPRYEVAQQERV